MHISILVLRSVDRPLCSNSTAILPITHHFLAALVAKNKRGLIAFTSSSANLLPNPLSALYSATKAFMTMFAVSLAGEVRAQGIDIVVVHPSPIASNFFNNGKDLDALMFFKNVAQGPSVIADVVFSSAGRFGRVVFEFVNKKTMEIRV